MADYPPQVGMVGGGQLARMTCQAAIALGIGFRILADSATDSAAQVWASIQLGDYRSLDDLTSFAAGCDVLTFDHEHVPGEHLLALERAGVQLRPGPAALRFTQDKLAMRDRLTALGIACPRYAAVKDVAGVEEFAGDAWPVVLKAVSGGYDGKGVWVCRSAAEAAEVMAGGARLEFLAEEYVRFGSAAPGGGPPGPPGRELAVLAARSPHNQGAVYPVVQTVQVDGICREVIAPAPDLAPGRAAQAQALALRIAAELEVTGLLAVELFETAAAGGPGQSSAAAGGPGQSSAAAGGPGQSSTDGLLVNELAMRPHNCGHWSIDGARTSQFEQHLRAVLDLPLGSPEPSAPVTVMANVLGGDGGDVFDRYIHVMAADPGVKVHMYGKESRPGRKIGHVTVCGTDVESLRERARRAASYLRWGTEDGA